MSTKEQTRRKIASAVLVEAWKLKRQTILFTYKFGTALWLAWRTVRSRIRMIRTNVRGVTFGSRQKQLRILAQHNHADVRISIERDIGNPFDENALKVIATLKDGSWEQIGYIAKEVAAQIAPALDVGKVIVALFDGVTGQHYKNGYLGCTIRYTVI